MASDYRAPLTDEEKALAKRLTRLPDAGTPSEKQIDHGKRILGSMTCISEWLYLGSRFDAADASSLRRARVTCVVNLARQVPNFFDPQRRSATAKIVSGGGRGSATLEIQYHNEFCCEDTPSASVKPHFPAFCRLLESVRKQWQGPRAGTRSTSASPSRGNGSLRPAVTARGGLSKYSGADNDWHGGGAVLVHCKCGVSRAPTFVLAYLMKFADALPSACGADPEVLARALSGLAWLKQKRPCVSPNDGFVGQLAQWELEPKPTGRPRASAVPGRPYEPRGTRCAGVTHDTKRLGAKSGACAIQ
jgi:hypothetical protein